jgi:hypothetical protein
MTNLKRVTGVTKCDGVGVTFRPCQRRPWPWPPNCKLSETVLGALRSSLRPFFPFYCILILIFVRIDQLNPPPISSPSGHPPMQCTILSNPRASPTSSPQPTPIHHPGHVPPIHSVHHPLLPVIPSTPTAIFRITCTTRTPSHIIPLHLQMEVSPSTSSVNPLVLDRAHREVPPVRSSHLIGSSSYSNARCVTSYSRHRIV